MAALKIINGTKDTQRKKPPAWWYMERYAANVVSHLEGDDRYALCGAVYCMVRHFLLIETDDYHSKFRLACKVRDVMSEMTPREILLTFPPKKTYDGDKWSCIDYFSTMEKFRDVPMDEPAGENLLEMLNGYSNDIILDFLVKNMLLVTRLHREQTGRDILDDFMESQGKPPLKKYHLHTDSHGKQYMVDDDGHSFAVKKHRPRYLRVVK